MASARSHSFRRSHGGGILSGTDSLNFIRTESNHLLRSSSCEFKHLNSSQTSSKNATPQRVINMACANEYTEHFLTLRLVPMAISLYSPTAIWRNIFLLILTACTKVAFTAWTFGMMVRSFDSHAAFFRSDAYPDTCGYILANGCDRNVLRTCRRPLDVCHRFLFSQCLAKGYIQPRLAASLSFREDIISYPPDPTVRCVSPAFYAVVGAASMLGGVIRMTGSSVPSP